MSNELTELPEGWELIKLSDVAEKVGSGATPRGGSESYKSSGIPLIRSMNIHFDGLKLDGLAYLDAQQADELKNVEVKVNDVLLNITGASIGRVTQAPYEMEGARVNQHVCIIRTHPILNTSFLSRYLASPNVQRWIMAEEYGATRQALTKQMILNFDIPLPPLNEQKRIVAKIEALRERSRRVREALEEIPGLCDRFRQSVLAAAFRGDLTADWRKQNQNAEWEEITLGDILKSKPRNGYSPKPVDYSTKVKSLTLTATTSGKFKPEHFKYIDEEIDQDSHLWLTPGDILIQRSNTLEYVGTCAIYDSNFGEFIYPDLMMKIQVIENKTKPEFIYYALSTETTRRYFKENATGTAGNMPKINQQVVMNTPIVLPSIEEQQEIIFRIQKLLKAADQIEQQYQEAKAYLDQLDQSILAKAFRGELVPQDPNDEPASVLLERIKAEREQLGEKKKTTRKSPTPRSRKPKTQTPTFEQMTLPGLDLEATEDVQ